MGMQFGPDISKLFTEDPPEKRLLAAAIVVATVLAAFWTPGHTGVQDGPDPVRPPQFTSDVVNTVDAHPIKLHEYLEADGGDDKQDTDLACSATSQNICNQGCRERMANVPGARYLLSAECDITPNGDGTHTRNCHCIYLGIQALRNFR